MEDKKFGRFLRRRAHTCVLWSQKHCDVHVPILYDRQTGQHFHGRCCTMLVKAHPFWTEHTCIRASRMVEEPCRLVRSGFKRQSVVDCRVRRRVCLDSSLVYKTLCRDRGCTCCMVLWGAQSKIVVNIALTIVCTRNKLISGSGHGKKCGADTEHHTCQQCEWMCIC